MDGRILELRRVADPGAFAEAATKSVTVLPDAGGATLDYLQSGGGFDRAAWTWKP
jgi:hypothetical protein